MATKADVRDWVEEELRALGGHSRIVPISRAIWSKHEAEIVASGDLFYTWQYDMRWGAHSLRKGGKMISAQISPRGVWELT